MLKTKWILFDFGGCLDSDGIHSRVLFFDQFKKSGFLNDPEDLYHFQQAYSFSDRKIVDEGLVVNADLFSMNHTLCSLIAKQLKIPPQNAERVAHEITKKQSVYLLRNKELLTKLRRKFRLGVISNFSGNLINILKDYSLDENFEFVLDSFHAGIEKPNPAIFRMAIDLCDDLPDNICFVGDNPERDISPAKKMGLKTVLISEKFINTVADYNISNLEDLLKIT